MFTNRLESIHAWGCCLLAAFVAVSAPSVKAADLALTSPNSTSATSTGASVASSESNSQVARDMLETIARLNESAKDIEGEVSRRKQEMVTSEHVFYDLATASRSQPFAESEMENVGPPLPPRKKWLDFAVEQMGKLCSMLDSEVSSLTIPDEKKKSKGDELRAQLDIAHDCMLNIKSSMTKVKSLSVGPTYDNAQIAAATATIQSNLSGLNTVRKRLVHLY